MRDHLPLSGRLIFKLLGGRYGDHRDWQVIEAWAEGVALGLGSRRAGRTAE